MTPPKRASRLTFEQTLSELLGLIGTRVEVTVTPRIGDWTTMVAKMTGVLRRGERRRLTLGGMVEDDDHESVFFSLDAAGRIGFALSKRVFLGASIGVDATGARTLNVAVEPNDVAVSACL